MKRTLGMIVSDILTKNKRKQFTSHQLAEIVMETEHEFCARKIKKTDKEDKALLFQLMSEISAQYYSFRKYNVGKTEDRPFKYFYKKYVAKNK